MVSRDFCDVYVKIEFLLKKYSGVDSISEEERMHAIDKMCYLMEQLNHEVLYEMARHDVNYKIKRGFVRRYRLGSIVDMMSKCKEFIIDMSDIWDTDD
jgi:hypothetical protein